MPIPSQGVGVPIQAGPASGLHVELQAGHWAALWKDVHADSSGGTTAGHFDETQAAHAVCSLVSVGHEAVEAGAGVAAEQPRTEMRPRARANACRSNIGSPSQKPIESTANPTLPAVATGEPPVPAPPPRAAVGATEVVVPFVIWGAVVPVYATAIE
jgi:hypothetical protein